MTYLQLMMKCLSFIKNETIEEFGDNDDLNYKSEAKKAIMYLILLEAKNNGSANNHLLDLLEKDLSYFDVSLCKTLEKAEEKAIASMLEDPYMSDQIGLLRQELLTDAEQNEIINELLNKFQQQIPEDLEVVACESAIHTIMELVSKIIPELFFTEKGYEYIDKDYQIEDIDLRERCYEYLRENIHYYNLERIYRVDKGIYSELYEAEDEEGEAEDSYEEDEFDDYDEESLFLDEDESIGQVFIYGEDIDNYDILYYSATLLMVMLRLAKNKQYDKIKKLIELDEAMTNFYDGYSLDFSFYYSKTMIESLYQPKTMDRDYHRKMSTPPQSDFYLDFFLSDNEFTQQYTTEQLSLIISYCFDIFNPDSINKIYENSGIINDILSLTHMGNKGECLDSIKRLIKIKNDNGNNSKF